jgi:rhomboid protease GluP
MDDPVVLVQARSRRQLDEAALVLRAVGIAHGFRVEDGLSTLVVPRRQLSAARHELERYTAENPVDPAPRESKPSRVLVPVWPGLIAYAAVLVFVYVEQAGVTDNPVTLQGRLDAARFLSGEWWRCVTALCLHVDAPHLAGNLMFGAAFGALLAQLVGNGVGWTAILLGGALGNALDAWVQPLGHVSMGASTAVFSALGILTALSLRLHAQLRDGRIRRWAPLVMGIALLGFLGTGGTRTNVPAHALGFATGLGLGALLTPAVRQRAPGAGVQWLVGAMGVTLLALAWSQAGGLA